MEYNEKDLIVRSQNGESAAFGMLYDKYIRTIYDFIYYKTRHKETAEDITSQTFFKALKNIASVDSSKPFSSWLYKIAQNTVLDHYRTRHIAQDIDDIYDISDDTDIVTEIDMIEHSKVVKTYLQKLAPQERDLIIMRVWQELSYKEIGDMLGKSEASLKMMYSRSIKKLRDLMV